MIKGKEYKVRGCEYNDLTKKIEIKTLVKKYIEIAERDFKENMQ